MGCNPIATRAGGGPLRASQSPWPGRWGPGPGEKSAEQWAEARTTRPPERCRPAGAWGLKAEKDPRGRLNEKAIAALAIAALESARQPIPELEPAKRITIPAFMRRDPLEAELYSSA